MAFAWPLLLLWVHALIQPLECFSGIYFDNGKAIRVSKGHFLKKKLTHLGMGQTSVEPLNVEDQELMRSEILSLLGMKHVPNKKSPHFVSHMGNTTVSTSYIEGQAKDNRVKLCAVTRMVVTCDAIALKRS